MCASRRAAKKSIFSPRGSTMICHERLRFSDKSESIARGNRTQGTRRRAARRELRTARAAPQSHPRRGAARHRVRQGLCPGRGRLPLRHGRRDYLDFLSGYSVFNIGRNHPAVQEGDPRRARSRSAEHGADGLLAAERPAGGGADQANARSISTPSSSATPARKRSKAR